MSSDIGAHGDQHFSQIADLGFLRCIVEPGFTLRERGCHHEVFSSGHRHHVGGDARALQACQALAQSGDHVPVLDDDLGAHGAQAHDVLVHGPRANGATAGQRYPGLAETRQQRAQREHRRAHGLHQLVGRLRPAQATGVDPHHTVVVALDSDAHIADQLDHGRDVLQPRNILQRDRLGTQQRSAQRRQGGILGARNRHLTLQTPPATNQQLIHSLAIRRASASSSTVRGLRRYVSSRPAWHRPSCGAG